MNKLRSWKRRRLEQGYSYTEVMREIRRRARGEYRLPLELSATVLEAGSLRVALRFRLSALLLDFLKSEGFSGTEEDFLRIIGCEDEDHADVAIGCMLNPFPKYNNQTLRMSEGIDVVYPGKEVMPPN